MDSRFLNSSKHRSKAAGNNMDSERVEGGRCVAICMWRFCVILITDNFVASSSPFLFIYIVNSGEWRI